MTLSSWVRNAWRSKLKLSRTKTIRRQKVDSRRTSLRCESLEDRSLPSTFSNTFSVTGAGQFDGGDASTTSGSYFLGGDFDTGEQSIGHISSDLFGVENGAKATFDLAGRAGLDLGYRIFEGSIDASFSG